MKEAHAFPFKYSESQLTSCASSLLHNNSTNEISGRYDCRGLFLQHASHYDRPPTTPDETLFWNSFLATGERSESSVGPSSSSSKRIEAFLRSVRFVHRHNTQNGRDEGRRGHTVGLNRFSDLSDDELPSALSSHRNNLDRENASLLYGEESKNAFVTIDSDESISELGRRFRTPSAPSEGRRPSSPSSTVLPLIRGIFDSWWWIGERHDSSSSSSASQTPTSIEEHSKHSKSRKHRHRTKKYARGGDSFAVDEDNEMDGIDNDDDDEDEWDTYLNWSTEDNPDGVGIVHDAMDQVSCFCLREKERDFCVGMLY